MPAFRLVTAALLAVVAAHPAAAQENRETLPPGQSRVLVERYAQCVVRLQAAKVRAGLRAFLAGDRDDLPVIRECLSHAAYSTSEMTFSHDVNRYALAEALYAVDFGKAAAIDFDRVPAEQPATRQAGTSSDGAGTPAAGAGLMSSMRYLLAVGDCVARTDPAATRAPVLTEVETRAEAAALGAVQPVLAQCLPKGQTVRFNRTSLRGVLALSAWRLSDAAMRLPNKDTSGA